MVKLCAVSLLVGMCIASLHAAPPLTTQLLAKASRPPYIGCQDSSECGLGNCCVLGMGRFSIPTCQSVQETFGMCRPYGHTPFNATVGYPDGALVALTDVYRMFCPCAPGLACDPETTTCLDAANTEIGYIYNTVLV